MFRFNLCGGYSSSSAGIEGIDGLPCNSCMVRIYSLGTVGRLGQVKRNTICKTTHYN